MAYDQQTFFSLISKLGAARSIPAALRYMPHYYCDIELHILLMETAVVQINCLKKYSTTTALGTTLTVTVKSMQVKIRMTLRPLSYDYTTYGCIVLNTCSNTLG